MGVRCLRQLMGAVRKGKREPEDCTTSTPSTPPCQGLSMTESERMDDCWPKPRVIIVGAGLAGLSAAQRLSQLGITEYMVLEATDRPGGRVHSVWLGDSVVELGAQWISGGSVANSVYTLAASEGLIRTPIEVFDSHNSVFLSSEGRVLPYPAIVEYHVFDHIKKQAKSLCSSKGNLLNFFAIRIQQELLHYPDESRYDAERILSGLANGVRNRWGADLSCLSVAQLTKCTKLPGPTLRVPLGYVGVLAPLIRELSFRNIRYCKPVVKIKWDPTSETRARVCTDDGYEMTADYVIVTLPLGVLKAEADDLFEPCLPDSKKEAIEKIGVGAVNKVFLEYGRPWWAAREMCLHLGWSSEEISERGDWTKAVAEIEEVPGSKHIINFSLGGPEAMLVEECAEEEIAIQFTQLMRKFTGDPSLPYPCNVLRTNWCRDPRFRGSTSYWGIETRDGHRKDLTTPIPDPCSPEGSSVAPVILFAGEAVAPDGHCSSVHGARLSGIREAERIAQLTRKFKGPPVLPGCEQTVLPVQTECEKMKAKDSFPESKIPTRCTI